MGSWIRGGMARGGKSWRFGWIAADHISPVTTHVIPAKGAL
jgi:hypothetical protein